MSGRMEKRVVALEGVSVRKQDDGSWQFEGIAAVFNSWTTIGAGRRAFREQVAPTAFNRTVSEGQDVRHLINHDPNRLLGRTTSGTTRLSIVPEGLRVVTDLPDTTYARDMAVLAERGDLTQMSFGFMVPEGGDTWARGKDGVAERTLADLDTVDVSSVTFPAYPETSGGVFTRAAQVAERADIAWQQEGGFSDLQSDIQAALPDAMDAYVQDVALDCSAALVCSWGDNTTYVVPITMGADNEPTLAPMDEWITVESQYVAVEANSMKAAVERLTAYAERGGKVLSQDNADHLTSALSSATDMLTHLQTIADAAGVTAGDDADLGADENLSDGSDTVSVVVGGNSANQSDVARRQRELELDELRISPWAGV